MEFIPCINTLRVASKLYQQPSYHHFYLQNAFQTFSHVTIMEKNIGMNPVVMILALSVWSFVLGLPGLLIGVPLTSLIIIYAKRFFLEPFTQLNQTK